MKKTIVILILMICYLTNFAQETGTFTDTRDKKVYKTVKIGSRIWMAENLAFKANSGCWAYNNDVNNVSKYGYLYSWQTAKTVCPNGWHFSTKEEWEELEATSNKNDVGAKLKSSTGWTDVNGQIGNGTNLSGFTALPGGCRDFYGKYCCIGTDGYWWSSIDQCTLNAALFSGSSGFSFILDGYADDKNAAVSLRCVKD